MESSVLTSYSKRRLSIMLCRILSSNFGDILSCVMDFRQCFASMAVDKVQRCEIMLLYWFCFSSSLFQTETHPPNRSFFLSFFFGCVGFAVNLLPLWQLSFVSLWTKALLCSLAASNMNSAKCFTVLHSRIYFGL